MIDRISLYAPQTIQMAEWRRRVKVMPCCYLPIQKKGVHHVRGSSCFQKGAGSHGKEQSGGGDNN